MRIWGRLRDLGQGPCAWLTNATGRLQEFKDTNSIQNFHKDNCTRLQHLPFVDKYITSGQDGTLRLWQAHDLTHFKTINIGPTWVTDFVYSPRQRKIVTTTMDRAVRRRFTSPKFTAAYVADLSDISCRMQISYFDVSKGTGSYDLKGRVFAGGSMGVPMCISTMSYGYDQEVCASRWQQRAQEPVGASSSPNEGPSSEWGHGFQRTLLHPELG